MLVGAHYCRREGQDTQDELERRDLKEELEERERKHFSSKDKGYGGNFTLLFIFTRRFDVRLANR